MTTSAADRYRREKVLTATPAELVGMLYDAALRALVGAQAARLEGDELRAGRLLIRAQDVVGELRCSLNPDAGEIATNLDRLYGYLAVRLIHANIKRDDGAVAEAATIVRELQTAWREACLGQTAVAG